MWSAGARLSSRSNGVCMRCHQEEGLGLPPLPQRPGTRAWKCSTVSGLGGASGGAVLCRPRHISSLSDRTSTCRGSEDEGNEGIRQGFRQPRQYQQSSRTRQGQESIFCAVHASA